MRINTIKLCNYSKLKASHRREAKNLAKHRVYRKVPASVSPNSIPCIVHDGRDDYQEMRIIQRALGAILSASCASVGGWWREGSPESDSPPVPQHTITPKLAPLEALT